MRVSPEKQLEFMQERQARAAAQAKAAQEAELHAARIKLMGAQGLYYTRGGAGWRGGAADAVGMFDPMAGFDDKGIQGRIEAQVIDEAKEAAATGKPWTAKQQAQRADELFTARQIAHRNTRLTAHTAGLASAALRAASGNPALYAQRYQQSLDSGLTAEQLMQSGFSPPQVTAAKPTTTSAATAPTKKPMTAADIAALTRNQAGRQAVAAQ
jgi:hypothetical protein